MQFIPTINRQAVLNVTMSWLTRYTGQPFGHKRATCLVTRWIVRSAMNALVGLAMHRLLLTKRCSTLIWHCFTKTGLTEFVKTRMKKRAISRLSRHVHTSKMRELSGAVLTWSCSGNITSITEMSAFWQKTTRP